MAVLKGSSILKFVATVLVVMIGIFAVKAAATKWNIPVISNLAKGV